MSKRPRTPRLLLTATQSSHWPALNRGGASRTECGNPHHHTTTYDGNTIDGKAIAILGNVHGDIHFPDGSGGSAGNRCLRDLRVTDPREDRARIEGEKDKLLKDCYAWILDDTSFQRWRTHGKLRLLWIKGDLGKGKTMMTMGMIAELLQGDGARLSSRTTSKILAKLRLSSKPRSKAALVAYFFCQSTRPELNNAASVLRGLIYLLVEQREELMRHVQKRHEAAGRQLFKDPNAIYALREMLSDILNDASLPPTYLLVDALDDCTMSLLQKMPEAVAALQKLQSIVRVRRNLMR